MEDKLGKKPSNAEMYKQGRTPIVKSYPSGSRIDEESGTKPMVDNLGDEEIRAAITEALPSYESLMRKVYSPDNEEMLNYAMEKFSTIPQERFARSAKLENCLMICRVEKTTPSIVPIQKTEPIAMSLGDAISGLSENRQDS